MRSFIFAGVATLIAAVISTGIALYASDYVARQALQQRVVDRTADWQKLITVYTHALETQRQAAEALTRGQITAVHQLIAAPLADGLFEDKREDILTRLSEQEVGKTGYVWIIDSEGTYVLSKDRARDGENIVDAQNSRGVFPTQDIIAGAQTLDEGEIGTYVYYWQNPGDSTEREKVASYVYFPEIDWIIGVGAYYDDLENATDALSLEQLKDMMAAEDIGPSGYLIARTSDGVYEVSKDRARDGENIWDIQDAYGNYIVRDHTETALAHPEGGTFSEYYWQNNDDPSPRKKIGSYAYVEDIDWVIAATAYYDDRPLLSNSTPMIFLLSIVGFGVLFFGFVFFTRRPKQAAHE